MSAPSGAQRRGRLGWIAYACIVGCAFVVLNVYLSWLAAKVHPFAADVVTSTGMRHVYELPRLAPMTYACRIDTTMPGTGVSASERDWNETLAASRAIDNVRVSLQITDGDGWDVAAFEGRPRDWHGRFDATPFTTYTLAIDVIYGDPAATAARPRLTMKAIGDGYAWARRPYLNAILAMAAVVVAGLIAAIPSGGGYDTTKYVSRIEDRFGLTIPDDVAEQTTTVGALHDYIRTHATQHRDDSWAWLRAATAEEFGVDAVDVRVETRFVEDLGC